MNKVSFLNFEATNKFTLDIADAYSDSKSKFENCRQDLTNYHKNDDWRDLENAVNNIDSMINSTFLTQEEISLSTVNDLTKLLTEVDDKLDVLIQETEEEIQLLERINQRAIIHGTLTLSGLGVMMVFILLVGGKKFISKLTYPIRRLEKVADSIRAGDRQVRVDLYTGDEFEKLANTFNSMLDSLDESTVTKEYFQNIFNSLYGALFIINECGVIRSINRTSLEMFDYHENELINKPINLLFDVAEDQNSNLDLCRMSFQKKVSYYEQQQLMISKNGKQIPVQINCTRLKSQNVGAEEILIVAHDITEKVMIEKKLEQNRNEIRIAINEAQEKERLRLATELHDGIAQQLAGVSYSVQKLHESRNYQEALVVSIQNQIDNSLRETRRLSHDLIPIVLIELGLIMAIKNLIDNVNKLGKTEFKFFHYDIHERLDNITEKAIFRICQEAINNILKHAKAKNASIQFLQNTEQVTIIIEDDGVGFETVNRFSDETVHNEGIGLYSIRERVTNFNGKFTIESHPGEGTELIIEIPYNR